MTTFQDREEAFERKYQHDEELRFKVEARQAKLFGLFVAGQLGLSDDSAQAYAMEMVRENLKEPGDDDMRRKAVADLTAAGKTADDTLLKKKLAEFFEQARTQVMNE